MVYQDYVCDECGYSYTGCGGLDFWMNSTALQTVSCVQCESLQDVPLGVNFYEILTMRHGPEQDGAMTDQLAQVTLACKAEPWHTVRPWASEEPGSWRFPDTIIAVCPRCEGHMRSTGGCIIFD